MPGDEGQVLVAVHPAVHYHPRPSRASIDRLTDAGDQCGVSWC
jgi:hypothetical protein